MKKVRHFLLCMLVASPFLQAEDKSQVSPEPIMKLGKIKEESSKKEKGIFFSTLDKIGMFIGVMAGLLSYEVKKKVRHWDVINPPTLDFSGRPVNQNITDGKELLDLAPTDDSPQTGKDHGEKDNKNDQVSDDLSTEDLAKEEVSSSTQEAEANDEVTNKEDIEKQRKNNEKRRLIHIKNVKPTYKSLLDPKSNRAHESEIVSLAFSKDGKFLLSTSLEGNPKYWYPNTHSKVKIHSIIEEMKKKATTKRKKFTYHDAAFFKPTWVSSDDPERWYFALVGDNQILRIIYLEKGELPDIEGKQVSVTKIGSLRVGHDIYGLAIHPDQTNIAVCTDEGITYLYKMIYDKSEEKVEFINKGTITTGINRTTQLAFSHDGDLLGSVGRLQAYNIWHKKNNSNYSLFFAIEDDRKNDNMISLSFAKDQPILAVSDIHDNLSHLYLHNVTNGIATIDNKHYRKFKRSKIIHSVVLFIYKNLLAIGLSDGSLEIWHVSINERNAIIVKGRLLLYEAHKGTSITALSFYGNTLAAGSSDGVITLWSWKSIEKVENILANYKGDISFTNEANKLVYTPSD